MEKEDITKPSIVDGMNVIIITEAFPPVSAGSSVLNKNLFTAFSSKSYTVFAPKILQRKVLDVPSDVSIVKILISFEALSSKIHKALLPVQMLYSFLRISAYIFFNNPGAVITTIPSYHYAKLALAISKLFKLPLILYMHDTLVEALSGSALEAKSRSLQKDLWNYATKIFVMSNGMKELYNKKYSLSTETLVHTYEGEFGTFLNLRNTELNLRFFWAGDVYNINKYSLGRISNAIAMRTGALLEMATPKDKAALQDLGLHGNHIVTSFYSNRSHYLKALGNADLLILALDWPDESKIHEDELATIFPTKTPEYLASGRLILVHAPAHYFLAKFFIEHNAGLVINSREIGAITKIINEINPWSEEALLMRNNAVRTAKIFERNKVASQFKLSLKEVI